MSITKKYNFEVGVVEFGRKVNDNWFNGLLI